MKRKQGVICLDAAAAARSTCICCHSEQCLQCLQRRRQTSEFLTSKFAALQRLGRSLWLQRIRRCLHGLGGEVSEGNLPEADFVGSSQVGGLESCTRWHSSVSRENCSFRIYASVHFLSSPHTVTYCSETTLIHGPTGTFVGEDELGNKYYENNNNQVGKDS